MTLRALVGLALLNLFLLAVGAAALAVASRLELVARARSTLWSSPTCSVSPSSASCSRWSSSSVFLSRSRAIILTGVGVAVAAVALRRPFAGWRPQPTASEANGLGLGLVAAAFGVLLVVYLEALFRASRLAGLSAWDAWAFWVPKAKAIYFFGGLDEQFFRELAEPDATHRSFRRSKPRLSTSWARRTSSRCTSSSGSSPAGSSPRSRACSRRVSLRSASGPTLLLVLATPRVVGRNLDPQADFLLDYLFALSALLVLLWLLDSEPWLLVTATPLLAAGLLTKRDGQLLVACVVLAAMAASCAGLARSPGRACGSWRRSRSPQPSPGGSGSRHVISAGSCRAPACSACSTTSTAGGPPSSPQSRRRSTTTSGS